MSPTSFLPDGRKDDSWFKQNEEPVKSDPIDEWIAKAKKKAIVKMKKQIMKKPILKKPIMKKPVIGPVRSPAG